MPKIPKPWVTLAMGFLAMLVSFWLILSRHSLKEKESVCRSDAVSLAPGELIGSYQFGMMSESSGLSASTAVYVHTTSGYFRAVVQSKTRLISPDNETKWQRELLWHCWVVHPSVRVSKSEFDRRQGP
jgi:hypothetical protein